MKIQGILEDRGQEGGQEEGQEPREAQGACVVRDCPEEAPELPPEHVTVLALVKL